jgi:hypothetical protein
MKTTDKEKSDDLNRERAEIFRTINKKMFEKLAAEQGMSLEEYISVMLKVYMEKKEKEK